MAGDLAQVNDRQVQLTRKESDNYTMLYTQKQRRLRKEGRVLQATMDNTPVGDIKILRGDMNAKLELDNTGRKFITGREALEEMNENEDLSVDFCSFSDLVIGGSVYTHKDIHKARWVDSEG
ncbi:unnamed protein product [Trichobilharzia szidati]|nr:unnamed protein product [Trichobilharzia szidati]